MTFEELKNTYERLDALSGGEAMSKATRRTFECADRLYDICKGEIDLSAVIDDVLHKGHIRALHAWARSFYLNLEYIAERTDMLQRLIGRLEGELTADEAAYKQKINNFELNN